MAAHRIDQLFESLAELGPYPPNVVPVPVRIDGTAFFPGGHGLWRPDPDAPLPPLPTRGIMIVGHNWGTQADHSLAVRARSEGMNEPTFRGLRALLDGAAIDRGEVFLTNAYMGLLTRKSGVGAFPDEPMFRARCLAFLHRQISIIQPRAILAAGGDAVEALGRLNPQLSCWLNRSGNRRSFVKIDEQGNAVRRAEFIEGHPPISVCALTHPCNANRQHSPSQKYPRRYGVHSHLAAEIAMVRDSIGA